MDFPLSCITQMKLNCINLYESIYLIADNRCFAPVYMLFLSFFYTKREI